MRAQTLFFLAAGLGTRLGALSSLRPKALVPLGDEPQLLRLLRRHQTLRCVANTFALADSITAAVASWAPQGLALALSRETELLGTAGGVRAARPLFSAGPVLIHNADIEVPPDVVHEAFADTDAEAWATLLTSPAQAPHMGPVGVGRDRQVVRLRDRQLHDQEEQSSCGYLGIAELSPACLAALPARGCLIGEALIPALLAGRRLRICAPEVSARAFAGFFDLGTPASYLAANLRWLEERRLERYVGANAVVHSAATQVVVGESGKLLAPAQRVVVWPGASVTEPLHDAIVFAPGRAMTLPV